MGTLLFCPANLANLHAYHAHLPHQSALLAPYQLISTIPNVFLPALPGTILCQPIPPAKFASPLALLVHPQLNALLVPTIIFLFSLVYQLALLLIIQI